jgi:xanthine dehydrogenase accessory factor
MAKRPALMLIKSASDVGSAVAHRLKGAGYRPVLLESPTPGATRRLMCFAPAVFTGEAELEGLRARRCAGPGEAEALAGEPGLIPLLVGDLDAPPAPSALPVRVLVDARLRKRREPPVQIGAAPLVIGIGPGFQAGVHCHVVIESNWGEALGRVLSEGASEAYTGRHRVVEGLGRERYLYAPCAGTFHSELDVLSPVRAGQAVGRVDDTPLLAEAAGILRGLAYSGLRVEAGAKLAEIDPSGDPANCRGIATRPARIAAGVLEAVERFHAAG